jgi:hypothetical protein
VSKERIPLAKEERRIKSELFREMFHVYQRYRRQHERDEERWGMDLTREAKEGTKHFQPSIFAQSEKPLCATLLVFPSSPHLRKMHGSRFPLSKRTH